MPSYGPDRNVKIFYFAVVNYIKIQFGYNSRQNSIKEAENINYKSIMNKFAAKKKPGKIIVNNNFIYCSLCDI